jgi:hypothetical protein
MELSSDLEGQLKSRFGKKEEVGHECVEMQSAVVPLLECGNATQPKAVLPK